MEPTKPPGKSAYQEVFTFYLDLDLPRRFGFAHAAFFGKNVLGRLGSLIRSWAGNWWLRRRRRVGFQADMVGKRWVVVGTRNHENSVAFLAEKAPYVLVAANFYDAKGDHRKIDWYPRSKLSYLPAYWSFFWHARRQAPGHFREVFHHLGHGMGVLENQWHVLRRYRPELIVLSNDHLPWYRALTVAARALGIPTVYLQHACVADNFPPLRNDLSLLDGQDALDKYRAHDKPIYGRVELVGMAKYEQYRELRNPSDRLQSLSIPYNLTDDLDQIKETVTYLRTALPGVTITLRKHPRDDRPFSITGVRWSDSRQEPALEFLRTQDAIIAGESSIHLEAALMNVSSVYFQFQPKGVVITDHYGFIANGLVPVVEDRNQLMELLRNWTERRPNRVDQLAYYSADPGPAGSQERIRRAIEELVARST
ncbi:MAG: hypothetical protein AAFZ52_06570 [Bacteroidota bacterium]